MAFDEEGQATDVEHRVAICERAYRPARRRGRLPAGGHRLRPERARRRDRDRGARRLRARVHRVPAADQGALPRRRAPLAASRTSASRSAATTSSARRCTRCSSTTRSAPGLDMGIVNAGQLAVYEDIEPELLERVEDVIFNRRPDATDRLVEIADRVRGEGTRRELDLSLARGAGREAARARARPRDRRLHRGGHRGGAAQRSAPARRDRRAADGRHARRRRPVRLGPDVPAAGREVGARDEARGRLPPAVHGGREGRRAQRAGRRSLLATVKGDVHDIGKNIVGVVLGCNDYEVIDLGVMVPPEQILDTAERGGRRRRRPLRADHAVARPDGRRRARDGAPAARAAAPDRRRDDVAPAHGGQDRARVRQRDRARARREPRRRRRLEPARPDAAAGRSTRRTARCRSGCASSTPRRSASRCSRSRRHARTASRCRFDDLPRAAVHRHARGRAGARRARPVHRLAVLLPRVGPEGQVPGDPRQPGGARALRRRAGAAARRSCRGRRCAARGIYGFWPAHADGDDVVAGRRRASASCASRPITATAARTAASPTTSRPPTTTSARSPSRSTAPTSSRRATRPTHDDYSAIAVKALADRLAEAFAEWLHAAGAARVVRARRAPLRRGSPQGELPRDPAGVRLPGLPGPQREAEALRPARRGAIGLDLTETFAMTAGSRGQRDLLPSPAGEVLRRRPDRRGPGRRLRGAQGRRRVAEAERWLGPDL